MLSLLVSSAFIALTFLTGSNQAHADDGFISRLVAQRGFEVTDEMREKWGRPIPAPYRLDGDPEGVLLLEDFAESKVGEFPTFWIAKNDDFEHHYRVAVEDGRQYLSANADEGATSIFRKVEWDIEAYPVMEWRWRARSLPIRGNEKDGRNDSALGVYVVFPPKMFVPQSLKYVWSTELPVSTYYKTGLANKGLVLESGKTKMNTWLVERRNIFGDYQGRFYTKRKKLPKVLGLITDADETEGLSAGDYDYFKVMTESAAAAHPFSPADNALSTIGNLPPRVVVADKETENSPSEASKAPTAPEPTSPPAKVTPLKK